MRVCVSLPLLPRRINAVGRLSAAVAAVALDPKSNEEVGRRRVGHAVRRGVRFRLITKSHYVLCHIQTQSNPDRPNPSDDVRAVCLGDGLWPETGEEGRGNSNGRPQRKISVKPVSDGHF